MLSRIFKIDHGGQSKSLFFIKNKQINNKIINELLKISKDNKEDYRICFHNNLSSRYHLMLISRIKRKEYFLDYTKREIFYSILKGKLMLIIFDKKKKIKKKIILDKNNPLFVLKKKQNFVSFPITNQCLFLEFIEGKFNKKKIFGKKFKPNQLI